MTTMSQVWGACNTLFVSFGEGENKFSSSFTYGEWVRRGSSLPSKCMAVQLKFQPWGTEVHGLSDDDVVTVVTTISDSHSGNVSEAVCWFVATTRVG